MSVLKRLLILGISAIVLIILAGGGLSSTLGTEKIIFLHHSTGGNVYTEGGVSSWFSNYNTNQNTNYQISEQWYPSSSDNYPYDFWNLWVNNNYLDSFTQNYDVVIFKHCYPGSDVLSDTGSPSVSSSRKSLENYKIQYRALRDKFDNYPNTLFIIWTLPPRNSLDNGDTSQATRANQFSEWLKKEFLTESGSHPNIYVFDFRSIVANSGGFLKTIYVYGDDSHPNTQANQIAGPLFAQYIIDAITNFSSTSSSTTDTDGDGIDDTQDKCISSGVKGSIYTSGTYIGCYLGDTDKNGCNSLTELFDYIKEWKSNNASLTNLLKVIGLWKGGSC